MILRQTRLHLVLSSFKEKPPCISVKAGALSSVDT